MNGFRPRRSSEHTRIPWFMPSGPSLRHLREPLMSNVRPHEEIPKSSSHRGTWLSRKNALRLPWRPSLSFQPPRRFQALSSASGSKAAVPILRSSSELAARCRSAEFEDQLRPSSRPQRLLCAAHIAAHSPGLRPATGRSPRSQHFAGRLWSCSKRQMQRAFSSGARAA